MSRRVSLAAQRPFGAEDPTDTAPSALSIRLVARRETDSQAGRTARALQGTLRSLAARFGLHGGHYVHLGHAVHDVRDACAASPIRFLATSASGQRFYLEEGGLAVDPPIYRLSGAYRPFVWSIAADRASDDAASDHVRHGLAGYWKGHGICGGVAAPIQDYAAGPAYVSLYSAFNSEAEAVIAAHGPELAYAVAAFHEEAKAKLAPRSEGRIGLTAREIECLRLAAIGFTAMQTAETLQVATRTVEFHLNNAAYKFGAANKLHAVALAVCRGLVAV